MLVPLFICAVLYPIVKGKLNPEPKVVGGRYINIAEVPHSASLQVKCMKPGNDVKYWLCGSSILNQGLLLTAAHCASYCEPHSYILAHVGDNDKQNPNIHSAHSYLIHEEFDPEKIENDIALVRMKHSFKFSSNVARVALMKNPPYNEKALLAGWGYIDEVNEISGDKLKAVDQTVWNTVDCKKSLKRKRKGVLCAASANKKEFPSTGDSGSALIVKGYIQIGLVSFKRKKLPVIYYSDMGYFYDWIKKATDEIFCDNHDAIVLL